MPPNLKRTNNSVLAAAKRGYVDTIIAPEYTRQYLCAAIERLYGKQELRADKKTWHNLKRMENLFMNKKHLKRVLSANLYVALFSISLTACSFNSNETIDTTDVKQESKQQFVDTTRIQLSFGSLISLSI